MGVGGGVVWVCFSSERERGVLMTVAKEYVVYNNPRASSDEVAEEMVRLLVRLRRHLQVRRR